eukprot:Skav224255  [mRNA]  locus=scaffold2636:65958:71034:+ [translate_table: standard]
MSDGDFIPSLSDLLGQLDEEDSKDDVGDVKPLVADPGQGRGDEGGDGFVAGTLSQLLKALPCKLAPPVGFFGWPLLEHVFMTDFEGRVGREIDRVWHRDMNPKDLAQELSTSEDEILKPDGDREDMAQQVLDLQRWRAQMQGRLRVMEQHLAWRVLGINETSDPSAIGKAFKRRALELHPDKGGDQQKFQVLQDMKGLLIPSDVVPKPRQLRPHSQDGDDTDEEIEQLIRARRKVETEDMVETPRATGPGGLAATRVKLHQAVLLAWDRFQDVGKKLVQFETAERTDPNGDLLNGTQEKSTEVLEAFQKFLRNFMAQHAEKQKPMEQFLTEGAEVLLAAALVDADATSSCIAAAFGATWGHLHGDLSHMSLTDLHQRLKASRCFGRKWGAQGRQRDIFPLGSITLDELDFPKLAQWQRNIFLGYVNLVIVALNFLHGTSVNGVLPRKPSAAQQDVQRRVMNQCKDFYHRLVVSTSLPWEHLVPTWVPGAPQQPAGRTGLQADCVDCLDQAGLCDPQGVLPTSVQTMLLDPATLFEEAPPGLEHFCDVDHHDRVEYIKLIVKQLRCGQLGLASSVQGGGPVFAVGKPGTQKVRAVWHGKRVSGAALPPPVPRHLASPTALLHLEASAGKPIRVSKRDARCWFDQLLLPVPLRKYMGRPAVSISELTDIGGLASDEVASFLEYGSDMEAIMFFPVSRVWPMGFSWSSYVAQEKLLSFFDMAGLDPGQVLACDVPTPESFEIAFAAATDDAMFFSNAGVGHTQFWANKFDAAMASAQALKHHGKDVNDEVNATCVGVCLEDGVQLAVPPQRCLAIILSVLTLAARGFSTPKDVHAVLSTMQWFDLLQRGKLSVYEKVYAFVGRREDTETRRIPAAVLEELLLGALLGVFWTADLTREFLPKLFASDASVEFGFGASYVGLPTEEVRKVARLAEKQGDYVVLDGAPISAHKSRLGQAHQLNLSKNSFVHILSVKRRRAGHINLLEGEAFLLLLRWILRSRQRHSSRVVVLVDSAVWLGAAAKGRSSTALNRLLRKAAALEMAGDLMVHVVLVPSSENPSDAPSRGARWKPKRVKVHKVVRLACDMHRRYAAALRIMGFGSGSDFSSDSSSEMSDVSNFQDDSGC